MCPGSKGTHDPRKVLNAILYHLQNKDDTNPGGPASVKEDEKVGGSLRPGIVHRLDKGTTGVMVIAKTQKCYQGLIEIFSEHRIEKIYETLAYAKDIPISGTLESTIGRHKINRQKMAINVPRGKSAKSSYKVLNYYQYLNHLQVKIFTGRTHQIRVHLSSILKTPILGDELYSGRGQLLKKLPSKYQKRLSDYPHPLLHAKRLGFIHPITKKKLEIEADYPDKFQEFLDLLKSEQK